MTEQEKQLTAFRSELLNVFLDEERLQEMLDLVRLNKIRLKKAINTLQTKASEPAQ